MEVVSLRWPLEEDRRRVLSGEGVPRLLIVAGEDPPPLLDGPLEDWIRVPASELDRAARVEGLRQRAMGERARGVPTIDDDGLVRAGPAWVAVPPVEARLAKTFIERFGAVVSRGDLTQAAWPEGVGERNVLDVRILRLRRRLDQIGLVIRTVRSRGYLMEWAV